MTAPIHALSPASNAVVVTLQTNKIPRVETTQIAGNYELEHVAI